MNLNCISVLGYRTNWSDGKWVGLANYWAGLIEENTKPRKSRTAFKIKKWCNLVNYLYLDC